MAQAGLGLAQAQAAASGDSYHQCNTDKTYEYKTKSNNENVFNE